MGVIANITQLSVNAKNHYCCNGKEIGKWWGKTLYYYKPEENKLYYENFSIFGRIAQLFGYKKEFNSENLTSWVSESINVKQLTKKDQITERVVLSAVGIFSDNLAHLKNSLITKAPDDTIIDLFEKGLLNVNITIDDYNTSVLHEVCRQGRYDLAAYLIEKGAMIDTISDDKPGFLDKTPLQAALQLGDAKLFLLLLNKKADVNTKYKNGSSLLHLAIERLGKQESIDTFIVPLLNKEGIQINEKDRNGKTPLYSACKKGAFELIELLVEKGADVNPDGPSKASSPLNAAIYQGNIDSVRYLVLNGAAINQEITSPDDEIPLATAIAGKHLNVPQNFNSNPKVIELLIARGANINQRVGEAQNTPLHLAVLSGNLAVVKQLIEAGANHSTIRNKAHQLPKDLIKKLQGNREIEFRTYFFLLDER